MSSHTCSDTGRTCANSDCCSSCSSNTACHQPATVHRQHSMHLLGLLLLLVRVLVLLLLVVVRVCSG